MSLQDLPTEVPLRVIEYCVVSTGGPILNLGPKRYHGNEIEKEDHPATEDRLDLNVTATCRAYRIEGWKCFWRKNHFVYTSPTALAVAMDWAENPSRPSTMGMMRHLEIRCQPYDDRALRILISCLQDCWRLNALGSLHIDFAAVEDPLPFSFFPQKDIVAQMVEACGIYQHRQKAYPNIDAMTKAVGTVSFEVPRRSNFGGPKEEIAITGLSEQGDYKVEIMAMRLMLSTMMPSGGIGFGRGKKGARYVYQSGNASPKGLVESKPAIEWVRASDAEQWIHKHGLFDRTTLRLLW